MLDSILNRATTTQSEEWTHLKFCLEQSFDGFYFDQNEEQQHKEEDSFINLMEECRLY